MIEFGLRPTYVFSSSFQAAAEMMVVIIIASQNYNLITPYISIVKKQYPTLGPKF